MPIVLKVCLSLLCVAICTCITSLAVYASVCLLGLAKAFWRDLRK
jgi:hypothetical protein